MTGPELHPWNEQFSWADHDGPFRCLTADEARQFDELGYVVIPDLVEADELAHLTAELDDLEAEVDAFLRSRDEGRFSIAETGAITFAVHAVTRSPAARAVSRSPRIVDLCADLVGPDVRLYWDQAVYKKTEKPRRFPWHQDNGYTFVEPQAYLTVWLALTDATAENGCPQVAPGLHRMGTLRHRYVEPLGWECLADVHDARVAEVQAGGAVVFSSLTPHMTGPNVTGDVRKAYILQYAPSGAAVLHGDPAAGPSTSTTACDDPARQYEVLRSGRPASA